MDLYQVCSYDLLRVKSGPRGSQVKTYEQKDNFKILLSETGTSRALIFGMSYFPVILYQVYSYEASGVKTGPAPGVISWNIGPKKTNLKILLVSNWKG